MATDRTEMDELVEERPVAGALVRHRGARMEQHGVERSAPRLELHHGALWIRATDAGPGVLASHGATTVQVREGAAVLEVSDFEALLVVVSGRAAVKGAAALPRSVTAGHAVTLTLDGGFGTPEPLSPHELQADRFVVENLARDVLAEAAVSAEEPPVLDGPTESLPPPGGGPVEEGPTGADPGTEPDQGTEPPPAAVTSPAAESPGSGYYDPRPISVSPPAERSEGSEPLKESGLGPKGSGLGPAPEIPTPSRRGLIAVVVVLVLLAAVIGATVLTGDDGGPTPLPVESDAGTEPVASDSADPEATLQTCEAGAGGYLAQGVVSGGGDGTTRYDLAVGLEDVDGEVYAEKTVTVDARSDPRIEVRWTVELQLAAEEIRPDSECRLVQVAARG